MPREPATLCPFILAHKRPSQPKKHQNAMSTGNSQAVTHPSTNPAQRCLTSVIRRELVCSPWYGHWREQVAQMHVMWGKTPGGTQGDTMAGRGGAPCSCILPIHVALSPSVWAGEFFRHSSGPAICPPSPSQFGGKAAWGLWGIPWPGRGGAPDSGFLPIQVALA